MFWVYWAKGFLGFGISVSDLMVAEFRVQHGGMVTPPQPTQEGPYKSLVIVFTHRVNISGVGVAKT